MGSRRYSRVFPWNYTLVRNRVAIRSDELSDLEMSCGWKRKTT